MIKMFVSDIDGTMMQHGGLIDEQDVAALRGLPNKMLFFASLPEDLIMKLQT